MLADEVQIFSNISLSRPLKKRTIKMEEKDCRVGFNTKRYSSKIRLKEKPSCKSKYSNGSLIFNPELVKKRSENSATMW